MPRTLFGYFQDVGTGGRGQKLLIADRAEIFCPAVDNFLKKDLKLFGNDRKGPEIKRMLLGSTIHISRYTHTALNAPLKIQTPWHPQPQSQCRRPSMLVYLRNVQNFQLPRYAIRLLNNSNPKVPFVSIGVQFRKRSVACICRGPGGRRVLFS